MSWVLALIATAGWLIEAANRRRQALAVARASHEVRGALTVIALGVDLGARAGRLGAERLEAMRPQIHRAERAIEALLGDQAGCREQSPVANTVMWLAGVHPSLDIDIEGEPVVDADPGRLAQVLGNLVANAVEHGAPPVCVRVTQGEGSVRIEVTDRGPGLPAPLRTLARRSTSRRRRGHGLAIAVAAARADGGQIRSAPTPGGARLVVEYPTVVRPGSSDAVKHRGGA